MGNGIRFLGSATAIVVASVLSLSAPASADSIHVFCSSPTPACLDNGSITPTSSNPPTFGFEKKGNKTPDSGTFHLDVLIPNDVPNAASESFTISSSYTALTPVNGVLASATAWTTGQLDTYLGRSANPTNPIGAFLPLTQFYDASATGYFVYDFNFGAVDFATHDPLFTVNLPFPVGTVVTAFLDTTVCKKTVCTQDWVGTPNSAALIITDGRSPPPLPEPATLSLLGAGLIGLRFLRRKRAA